MNTAPNKRMYLNLIYGAHNIKVIITKMISVAPFYDNVERMLINLIPVTLLLMIK